MTDPVEPTFPRVPEALIAELAPRARAWSRELCHHITPSGQSCAAYHGIWQYMRLFELVNPPWLDIPFVRSAVAEAAGRSARSALIAGCADYAVPAVMEWGLRPGGGHGRSHGHRCLRDAVARMRLVCRAHRPRGADASAGCDEISARAAFRPHHDTLHPRHILGLFSPAARRALVARWYELLVPGGLLATVNRIRRGAGVIERFSPNQARDFRERVVREAAAPEGRPDLGLSLDELAALADAYAAHNVVYPLHSLAEFSALLEGAGLTVESLAVRTNPADSRLAGPTMAGNARYAQLRASRP